MRTSSSPHHARWPQTAAVFAALLLAGLPALGAAAPINRPLSNPDASKEAQNVYRYMCGIYGKAILAGQQESTWVNNNPDDEMDYISKTTGGKLPAIRGLDYMAYNGVTERAIAWWQKGGIPTLCWHWGAPTKGTGYEASKLTISLDDALTTGTALNKAMMADLDRTARELVKLRDAHVPVLWRPFHENNGGWFWWGKGGAENFKKLWKLEYNYYTQTYKLNNLIWVFGYCGKPDATWYPGDAYVDIAGADSYGKGTQHAMFQTVLGIVGTNIPICYHECGTIPDPDALMADSTPWSYFMTWHTSYIKQQNTPENLKKIYNHPYVITLDKLPNLKDTSAIPAASSVPSVPSVSSVPGTAPAPATGDNAYVPPFDAAAAGLTPLFDGKTLNGWVGDPTCWKVVDGAIVGVKGNQNIMTVGDYDDFRIILSTRQVNAPDNHQGVGFWGEHMPAGKYGYGNCVDVMPPMNWTWDYTVNKGAPGKLSISKDLGLKRSDWTQAEILVNRAKGTIRMAVNGIEMLYYTDDNPSRLKKGPIGLQAHAGNQDVRYKDIFIEVNPKEDRLITLKK
jgi:hypothetical protein